MDRNREARRVAMAAAANGLSRRRHRASSLRDSPDEGGGAVELQEAARLRDRMKKDRDRDREREKERERDRMMISGRSKRRRGERLVLHGGDDDSSEESVNDDEEDDDGGGEGPPPPNSNVTPPQPPSFSSSSFSNHHHNSNNNSLQHRKSFPPPAKVFRSSPTAVISSAAVASSPLSSSSTWKVADEVIGVSVPRKARSVSTKRSHESSWASSAASGGFVTNTTTANGEQIHRQVSMSPAPLLTSPSPTSPSSSSVSGRKKMKPFWQKQRQQQQQPAPKSSSSCKSPPRVAQDEIEIEIAEVLYGMMRQPLGPPSSSKQESAGNGNDLRKLDSGEASNTNNNNGNRSTVGGEAKSRVSSPISNSQSTLPLSSVTLAANSSSSNTPVSAIAPKRKRPRPVKCDEEARNIPILSTTAAAAATAAKADIEQAAKTEEAMEKNSGTGTAENSSISDLVCTQAAERQKLESNLSLASKPFVDEESEKKVVGMTKEEVPQSPKKESLSGVGLDDDRDNNPTAMNVTSPVPEKEKQKEEKFQIDLMAPPPTRSSPEVDGEVEFVAGEAKVKAIKDVEMEANHLAKENEKVQKNGLCKSDVNLEPEEKRLKTTVVQAESQKQDRSLDSKFDLERSDRDSGNNKLNQHVQKPSQQQHQQQQQQQAGTERDAQTSSLPPHMSMPGWPGGLPPLGYMAPLQGVVSMDGSSLSSATMQPPQLFFNQLRPKRCATHCYIARNIQYHQQLTKMNPFWPAAAGTAPLYGGKAGNLNLMPSTELQGNFPGKGTNSFQDKSSHSTSNGVDAAQKKQILLQQALPPGAASNLLHGPAFIFPLSQSHAAAAAAAAASVRPAASANAASTGPSNSASMNGSASAGAVTMNFSYPNMPGGETQYLAILQNNGYPFPIPAHVGAPPAYRGAPGQAIPFFNGSFYSAQMLHPSQLQPQQQQQPPAGQVQQSQKPGHQNSNMSAGSSTAQKHLQNQQQPRPGMNGGTLQGFPAQKIQSQPLNFQHLQQPSQNTPHQSETAAEGSPSSADSRVSRANITYGQNFAVPMQPPNFGLTSTASTSGSLGASGASHGEKKAQQRGSKGGVEPHASQPFAMSFATVNGATTAPGLDMSSIAQNHAIFHSLPEAARQGYQMMAAAVAAQAAHLKMNYNGSEDGKPGPNDTSNVVEERKSATAGKTTPASGAQSIAFSRQDLADSSVSGVTGNNVVDSSARLLNLSSVPPRASGPSLPAAQQQLQRNQQQQQQIMQIQKQQQYAVAAAAAAARSKTPATSNGGVFSDHIPSSSVVAKFPNTLSGFPQTLVQTSGSPAQSQWKNGSTRTTTNQAPSPSLSSSTSSCLKNVPQKQAGRSQQTQMQTQISFAANSKSSSNSQVQQAPSTNQSPSPPMLVGSPSTSSISKSAGGSPRTTASTSTGNKGGQASSTLSSQPPKNSPSPAVPSQKPASAAPSILGNPHVSSTLSTGTKSQLPQQQLPKHTLQQAQLFFSGAYMQHHQQHPTSSISPASGFYLPRHRNEPQQQSQPVASTTTSTSDPAKAIATAAAAAAAATNMKGASLPTQGVVNAPASYAAAAQSAGKTHPLVPPGFPYIHAVPTTVQVKSTEQKQPAGE